MKKQCFFPYLLGGHAAILPSFFASHVPSPLSPPSLLRGTIHLLAYCSQPTPPRDGRDQEPLLAGVSFSWERRTDGFLLGKVAILHAAKRLASGREIHKPRKTRISSKRGHFSIYKRSYPSPRRRRRKKGGGEKEASTYRDESYRATGSETKITFSSLFQKEEDG